MDQLYLDGAFMALDKGCIRVEDRGFQFGDGVYEVVKVHNRRVLWLEQHLARLAGSLRAIHLAGVAERHDLPRILPRLVERARLVTGTVYVQVTRGVSLREFDPPPDLPPTVLAYTRERPLADDAQILAGVGLYPLQDFRWGRCDIKSTNLLASVLAGQEARAAGCAEVLWIGPEGQVREGGSSNLFCVIEGVVRTHPAGTTVLDGVTRKTVMGLARDLGLEVREQAVALEELEQAEEAFITSTGRDVLPVVSVGGTSIGQGRPGRATLALVDAMRAEVARLAGVAPPPPLAGGSG